MISRVGVCRSDLHLKQICEKGEEKKCSVSGGFNLSICISRKKTGGSHPGWNHLNRGIYHLTLGAGIVKGWEEKEDHRHIPDTFT